MRSEAAQAERERRANQTATQNYASTGLSRPTGSYVGQETHNQISGDRDSGLNGGYASGTDLATDRANLSDRRAALEAGRNPSAINNYAGTSVVSNPTRSSLPDIAAPSALGGVAINVPGATAATQPNFVDYNYDPAVETGQYVSGTVYTPEVPAVATAKVTTRPTPVVRHIAVPAPRPVIVRPVAVVQKREKPNSLAEVLGATNSWGRSLDNAAKAVGRAVEAVAGAIGGFISAITGNYRMGKDSYDGSAHHEGPHNPASDHGISESERNTDHKDKTGHPVLLDLSGHGIVVDPLSSSSQFLDLDGDGYEHRTAWVGQGTGVLVLDADGDGRISRSNEFVFTEWDSSATGDLEAIRNVFDSNHNGRLDAGDARWSEFKVMVDGEMKTLDALGIASIDLTPKGTGQNFADGSAITGTTEFTRTDGTKGTVGDAVLANDPNGYIIKRTKATNADGTVSEDILGYNKDGSLAFRNLIARSADGNNVRTQMDDDGNGTFDRSQLDVLEIGTNGVHTRTVSNFNADGSLLNSTKTVRSSDGRTVTTSVDQDGDGRDDQSEVFVTNGDGSSTTVTQAFSVDGTLIKQISVTSSADGLSKTTQTDANGDGVFELTLAETTVINAGGGRTKTVATLAADGTPIARTVTTTSADNRSKTVSYDYSGDGTADEVETTTIEVGEDGSITISVSSTNADGSLRDTAITTTTADGLSKTTLRDLTGDGVIDRISSEVTIVGVDGTRTQTSQEQAGEATFPPITLSQTVTVTSGDGKTITVDEDSNGDSAVDTRTGIIVAADGSTTTTPSRFNPDGSLQAGSTSQTSAGGLSTTTQTDENGDGVIDRIVSDVTVGNPDGSRTQTVTTTSGSGSAIGKTVTTTSADSLTQSAEQDLNGDDIIDRRISTRIVLNADGSRSQTLETRAGNDALLNKSVTVTAADRKTTTVTSDSDGDSKTDRFEIEVLGADGAKTITSTKTNDTGTVLARSITTTSADGLTVTTSDDVNGDDVVDAGTSSTTVINNDASRTTTVTTTSGTTLTSKTIATRSGNGLVNSVASDLDGNGVIDGTVTETVALNVNGSRTTTSVTQAGSSMAGRRITTVSANGLVTTIAADLDADGTADRTTVSTKTLNEDGSITETSETRSADGVLLARTVINTSADGRSVVSEDDGNGDGRIDTRRSLVVNANGLKTETLETLNPDGSLNEKTVTNVSADGLVIVTRSDVNGDGVYDRRRTDVTVINLDGSRTQTIKEGLDGPDSISDAASLMTQIDIYAITRTIKDDGTTLITGTRREEAAGGAKTIAVLVDATGRTLNLIRTADDGGSIDVQYDSNTGLSILKESTADGKLLRTIEYSADVRTSETVIDAVTGQSTVLRYDAVTGKVSYLIQNDSAGKRIFTKSYYNGVLSQEQTFDPRSGIRLTSKTYYDNGVLSEDRTFDVTGKLIAEKRYNRDGQISSDKIYDGFTGNLLTSKLYSTGNLFVDETYDPTTGNPLTKKTYNKGFLSQYSTYNLTTKSLLTQRIYQPSGQSTINTYDAITGAFISSIAGPNEPTPRAPLAPPPVLASTDNGTVPGSGMPIADPGRIITSSYTATTSANGLSNSAAQDLDGNGVVDRRLTTETIVNADGSRTVAQSTTAANGVLLGKITTLTSADRNTVITTSDTDGDGRVNVTVVEALNADGSKTVTSTRTNASGTVLEKSLTTTSADGLRTIIADDVNGDGQFDSLHSTTVTLNADGSRTETVTRAVGDAGQVVKRTITTTRADGLSETIEVHSGQAGQTDAGINEFLRINRPQKIIYSDGSYHVNTSDPLSGEIVKSENFDANGKKLSETTLTANGNMVRTLMDPATGKPAYTVTSQNNENIAYERWRPDWHVSDVVYLSDTVRVEFYYDGRQIATVYDGDSSFAVEEQRDGWSFNGYSQWEGQWFDSNRKNITDTSLIAQLIAVEDYFNASQDAVSDGGFSLAKQRNPIETAFGLVQTRLVAGTGEAPIGTERTNETTVLNADGSTARTTEVYSGTSLIQRTIVTRSANGLIAQSDVDADGNGVIDHVARSAKTWHGDGSITETTETLGTNGALFASTVTTTSADEKTVVVEDDINGDGKSDYRKETVLRDNGSITETTSQLKADGTLASKAVTETSASDLVEVSRRDANGDGLYEEVATDTMVLNADGSRTQTVLRSDSAGKVIEKTITTLSKDGLSRNVSMFANGQQLSRSMIEETVLTGDGSTVTTLRYFKANTTLESSSVTTVSGDGRTTTVLKDTNGDGKNDQRDVTVRNGDGGTVRKLTDYGADGLTIIDAKTIALSADGLTETTEYDTDGNGSADQKTVRGVVLNANGSRTETLSTYSANAGVFVLKARSVADISADGLTKSMKWDIDGNGSFDNSATDITVLNADGSNTQSLALMTGTTPTRRQQITTSANGLETVTRFDRSGSGKFDQTMTDVTVINADGTRTRTRSATKADASVLSRSVTTTSVDRLTTVTAEERAGQALRTIKTVTDRLADGSVVVTSTTSNAAGRLADRQVTTTSADKRKVVIERDADGDGKVDQREERVIAVDGSVTTTITGLRSNGSTANRTAAKTSADGLTTATEWDLDGEGTIDRKRTTVNTYRADGSQLSVSTDTDAAGVTVEKTSISISADGKTRTTTKDTNGNGTIDRAETIVARVSGATFETIVNNVEGRDIKNLVAGEVVWTRAIAAKIETTTAADGSGKTTRYDYDNNGVYELVMAAETQVDGSVITTITETNANGSVKARGVMTRTADGLTTILDKDSDNNGKYDQSQTSVIRNDGSIALTTIDRNIDGTLKQTVNEIFTASGKLQSSLTSDSQGRKTAETLLSLDGTATITRFDAATGKILSVVREGSLTATLYDPLNTNPWTRVEQKFDTAGKKISEIQYKDDGTRAETTFDPATGKEKVTNFFNAAGVLTGRITYDFANANPWAKMEQAFDAAKRLTFQSNSNDNGTRNTYSYDVAGSQSWTRVEQQYNTADKLTTETQYNDNGTRTDITFNLVAAGQEWVKFIDAAGRMTAQIQYDPQNLNTWTRVERAYDIAGRLTSQNIVNDNGTRYTYNWDPANGQKWARIERAYNTADQMTGESVYFDNGTRSQTNIDPANLYSWRSGYYEYNASGQQTYEKVQDDVSNWYEIFHDLANGQTWKQITRYYNAADQKTSEVNTFDDSTRDENGWDVSNTSNRSRWSAHFDALGRKNFETIYYDDGSRDENGFDFANTSARSWWGVHIDAKGRETSQTDFNDNGTKVNVLYDVANTAIWKEVYNGYDKSGRLSIQNFYHDNGTLSGTIYDTANTQAWSRISYNKDGAGQLFRNVYFDDGRHNQAKFSASGQILSYWTYDNDGNRISKSTGKLRESFGGGALSLNGVELAGLVPNALYDSIQYIQNVGSVGIWDRRPIILDLNADGNIDLIALDSSESTSEAGPRFDWDGDGIANETAWVGPHDGMLVIDLDQNGEAGADNRIEHAEEIAFSLWKSEDERAMELEAQGLTGDGSPIGDFEGLRFAFDTNKDNILNSQDARWNEFRIWQDTNQNGISDQGELKTMAQAGIILVNLLPSLDGVKQFADGSGITGTSSYEMINGGTRLAADATLAYRPSTIPA